MTLPVAILAGGFAKRLGSLAKKTPKSLIDVAGKPFAVHQLELLHQHGMSDVVFCLGHLGEQVQRVVGDGSAYGVRVRYSYDGDQSLGTGGALRKASPLLGSAFLVLYGDSYLDCDYGAVANAFLHSGRAGLMTVFRNEDRWDRSNVVCENGRILRYDKVARTLDMRHIDYGLGALTDAAVQQIPPEKPFDLAALYQGLIEREQLAAYEVPTRFYEIGTPSGLAETCQLLSKPKKNGTADKDEDPNVAASMPCLVGRLVTLRSVMERDLDQLRAWYNDPAIFPFMALDKPLTETDQSEWFNKLRDNGSTKVFSVDNRQTNELIGSLTLRNLTDPARRGELGILIGQASSGYGSDAIRTLLAYAFGSLKLNCVSLEVRGDNRRAITAYMRAGFRPEGVLRRRMRKGDVIHDLYSMSILREEFLQESDGL